MKKYKLRNINTLIKACSYIYRQHNKNSSYIYIYICTVAIYSIEKYKKIYIYKNDRMDLILKLDQHLLSSYFPFRRHSCRLSSKEISHRVKIKLFRKK